MKKSTLRRKIMALEQQYAKAAVAEKIGRADREELMDRLADAGLILVKGTRTQGDRIRAARAGVLVLDDVHLLQEPQFLMTQEQPQVSSFGQTLRVPAGPLRAEVTLTITGDPDLLELLSEHLTRR